MPEKVFTVVVAIIVVVAVFFIVGRGVQDDQLGALRVLPNAYTGASTMSSTSVGVTATSILTASADRMWAKICNYGSGVVYIRETATDTSATIEHGIPISSSTAYETCYVIDANHPYLGQVYGVADATTTVYHTEQ